MPAQKFFSIGLCIAIMLLSGDAFSSTITTGNLIANPGAESPLAGEWQFAKDTTATIDFAPSTSSVGSYAPSGTYQFRTTVYSSAHHWALAYQDIILPADYTITEDTIISWGTSLRMNGSTGVHREMQASVTFYSAGYQQNLGSDTYSFYQWPEIPPANAIADVSRTFDVPEATKIIRFYVSAYKGTNASAIYGFDNSFVILQDVEIPDPPPPPVTVPEPISLILFGVSIGSMCIKKYIRK
ncbi:MAG: hypothetical protein AB1454_01740 [Candidatus Auribacterota bacterium]